MKTLKLAVLIVLIPLNTWAQEVRVACAANFILPMKEISKKFEKEKNIIVINTFGSTGMLFGQIKNGAPFDIFFAADTKRPKRLVKEKLANNFFIYAKGKSVLWTKSKRLKNCKDYKEVLKKSVKVSIANPKAAPYGETIIDLLKKENLYNDFQNKLVFGKNVAQAFQYSYSNLTDSGFCALSQAISGKGKKGKYFTLQGAKNIVQGGCVLKNESLAKEFLEFLLSSEKIIKKYGYIN